MDYSYYYIYVAEIVWDDEEAEFRMKSQDYWFGTGYAAYSFDHYNTASYHRESGEFDGAGYQISYSDTLRTSI